MVNTTTNNNMLRAYHHHHHPPPAIMDRREGRQLYASPSSPSSPSSSLSSSSSSSSNSDSESLSLSDNEDDDEYGTGAIEGSRNRSVGYARNNQRKKKKKPDPKKKKKIYKKSSERPLTGQMEIFDASIRPTESLQVKGHYNEDYINAYNCLPSDTYAACQEVEAWFLFIPHEFFTANSRGFSDMIYRTECNMPKNYQKMYQLMLYVRREMLKDIFSRVKLIYELVLAKGSDIKDENKNYAGRRWRLTASRSARRSFGKILHDLILSNKERMLYQEKDAIVSRGSGVGGDSSSGTHQSSSSSSSSSSFRPTHCFYKYLTFNQWVHLVRVVYNYAPPTSLRTIPFEGYTESDLANPTCIYNPSTVANLIATLHNINSRVSPDDQSCSRTHYVLCISQDREHQGSSSSSSSQSSSVQNYVEYDQYDESSQSLSTQLSQTHLRANHHHEHELKQRGNDEDNELGAHQMFVNWKAYVFPHHGLLAWEITEEEYAPWNFRYKYFPEIVQGDRDMMSMGKQMYLLITNGDRHPAKNGADPSQVFMGLPDHWKLALQFTNHRRGKSRAIEYDERVNMNPILNTPFELKDMLQLYQSKMEIKLREGKTRRQIQMIGLDDFYSKMWHLDAILPPTNKAIIRFQQHYLSTYGSYARPTVADLYPSISPLGNLLIRITTTLETADGVNTYHIPLVGDFLACLGVYSGEKNQINHAALGPNSAGKSQRCNHCFDWLIPGTARTETYDTEKAMTAEGDINDPSRHLIHHELVRIQDEAPPAAFGIKDGKSDSSQGASIRKYQLTTGTTDYTSFIFENNQRVSVHRKVPCIQTNILGSNITTPDMSLPIFSRLFVTCDTKRCRVQNGGLLFVMLNDKTKEHTDTSEQMIERIQLIQASVCEIMKLISVGILKPVNMTIANTLIYLICEDIYRRGLRSGRDPRPCLRLRLMVRVLAIVDAVVQLLFHSSSDLYQRPWDNRYWLLAEKYMYAKQEHVSLAFGLLEEQWESPLKHMIREVVWSMFKARHDGLKYRLAEQTIANGMIGEDERPITTDDIELTNLLLEHLKLKRFDAVRLSDEVRYQCITFLKTYYIYHVKGVSNSRVHNSSNTNDSTHGNPAFNHALLNALEKEIVNSGKLEDTLNDGVMKDILKGFLDTTRATPILIHLGRNWLAIKRNPKEGDEDSIGIDIVKSAVTKVLQHRYAIERDILYGKELHREAPFLFDVIHIRKGRDTDPVLQLFNPGFRDTQLVECIQDVTFQDFQTKGPRVSGPRVYGEERQIELINVVEDIDELSAKLRAIEIGLSKDEKLIHPSYLPSVQSDENWKRYELNHRCEESGMQIPYPYCYKEAYPDLVETDTRYRRSKVTYTSEQLLNDLAQKSTSMPVDPSSFSSSSSSDEMVASAPEPVDQVATTETRDYLSVLTESREKYNQTCPIDGLFDIEGGKTYTIQTDPINPLYSSPIVYGATYYQGTNKKYPPYLEEVYKVHTTKRKRAHTDQHNNRRLRPIGEEDEEYKETDESQMNEYIDDEQEAAEDQRRFNQRLMEYNLETQRRIESQLAEISQ